MTKNDQITRQVSERYARAAATAERMCCPTGYNFEELAAYIPEEVMKVSYGCGTPVGLETARPGESVLDIGSGGGIDCFEALKRVGPTGRVIGLDMTDEMLAIARRNAPIVADNLGCPASAIEFRKGLAEAMPADEHTIDLVISNCVINLSPDKHQVFREMYRVLRPGGRFTISDIVADQPVPNYLVHDPAKWGDCLSGALSVQDYLDGLGHAGFLGIQQVAFNPWQVIDGIHFLSLTLTGYKLPVRSEASGPRFATLRGPFSAMVDERGRRYQRGNPEAIDGHTDRLLQLPPLSELFVLSETPVRLDPTDARYVSIRPENRPCVWKGDFVVPTGPFLEAMDDDDHVFRRGRSMEICSKTLAVLETAAYGRHFSFINRAQAPVATDAGSCSVGDSCCA